MSAARRCDVRSRESGPGAPVVLCSDPACARELTRAECHDFADHGGLCDDCWALRTGAATLPTAPPSPRPRASFDVDVLHALDVARNVRHGDASGAVLRETLRALTPAQSEAYYQFAYPVHAVARSVSGRAALLCTPRVRR